MTLATQKPSSQVNEAPHQAVKHWLMLLLTIVIVVSGAMTVHYLHQPLLERHAFRQTQTALSAYWMLRDGLRVAYETPILGAPWAIPFEFPIYQWVVVSLVRVSDLPLDTAGRLVSYLFLLACCGPVFPISRRLQLDAATPWVFCCLLLSSPIYLFWGRTFMIETAALFFIFAALPFALDVISPRRNIRAAMVCCVLASVAVLQKATTAAPVLLMFGIFWLFQWWRDRGFDRKRIESILYVAIAFGIPLLLGVLWTHYTDSIKLKNAAGADLTSAALQNWNFGSIQQRLTFGTYSELLVKRVLAPNFGAWLGFFLIAGALVGVKNKAARVQIACCVLLYLVPMLIFLNLHLQHDYYQIANGVFLVGGLAITCVAWAPQLTSYRYAVPALTTLLVLLNLAVFQVKYMKYLQKDLSVKSERALAVSDFLRSNTFKDSAIIIFGNDWSSDIGYYAQRKSFTVSDSFSGYEAVWLDPEKYLGGLPLSAIVVCRNADASTEGKMPSHTRVVARSNTEGWQLSVVHSCDILLRQMSVTLGQENDLRENIVQSTVPLKTNNKLSAHNIE